MQASVAETIVRFSRAHTVAKKTTGHKLRASCCRLRKAVRIRIALTPNNQLQAGDSQGTCPVLVVAVVSSSVLTLTLSGHTMADQPPLNMGALASNFNLSYDSRVGGCKQASA